MKGLRHIIVVSGDSEQGGVGTFVVQLCDLLRLTGDDALILTGSTSHPGYYRTVPCQHIEGFDRIPRLRAVFQVVRRLARAQGATVICHGTAGLLTGAIAKVLLRARVRIVCVFHGLASRYAKHGRVIRMIEHVAARISDAPVFLTKTDRDALKAGGKVIPNAVRQFATGVPDPYPHDANRLVVVARHARQKNIQLIMALCERNPHRHAWIFGGGEDFEVTAAYMRGRNIQNVHLERWATPAEIYKRGGVFVLPTFAEGFPLSLLEAASCGLPLLVSNIPELHEICGSSAQYFDNDAVGSLEALLEGLSKKQEYESWALKARLLADGYSYERWSESWSELLSSRG